MPWQNPHETKSRSHYLPMLPECCCCGGGGILQRKEGAKGERGEQAGEEGIGGREREKDGVGVLRISLSKCWTVCNMEEMIHRD